MYIEKNCIARRSMLLTNTQTILEVTFNHPNLKILMAWREILGLTTETIEHDTETLGKSMYWFNSNFTKKNYPSNVMLDAFQENGGMITGDY